jgi:hypothetical protein
MTERLAIRVLRTSNWHPGRRVDITDDLVALEREGYAQFPAATNFLREYSGLTVKFYRNGFDRNDGADEVWFSVSRACELLDPAWTEEYSRRARVQLVPLGATYREHLALLIGVDGNWYGGFDDEFGLVGSDVLDLMENLIENKGLIGNI